MANLHGNIPSVPLSYQASYQVNLPFRPHHIVNAPTAVEPAGEPAEEPAGEPAGDPPEEFLFPGAFPREADGEPGGQTCGFDHSSLERENAASDGTSDESYEPTLLDVIVVKAMLRKAMRLPAEVVDAIADHAEYWPYTSTSVSYNTLMGDMLVVRGGNGRQENTFLLRTVPVGFPKWPRTHQRQQELNSPPPPRPVGKEYSIEHIQQLIGTPETMLAQPCRKIVFTIRSRDQGWGGTRADHGTYRGSWTWFEAGLERWCEHDGETRDAKDDHDDNDESEGGGISNQRELETNPWSSEPQQPEPNKELSRQLDGFGTVYPKVVRSPATDAYAFEHPVLPVEELKVQCNVTSVKEVKEHRVAWRYTDDCDPSEDPEALGRGRGTNDGEFVRNLKLGDVVTLWAKARFPGWANHIESVRVDVYWAI